MSDIDQLVEVPGRQLHTHSQKRNLYKDDSLKVVTVAAANCHFLPYVSLAVFGEQNAAFKFH